MKKIEVVLIALALASAIVEVYCAASGHNHRKKGKRPGLSVGVLAKPNNDGRAQSSSITALNRTKAGKKRYFFYKSFCFCVITENK